jgi:hypothetical protein
MRYPAPDPVDLNPTTDYAPWAGPPKGPMALPGAYSVTLSKRVQGELVEIADAQSFALKPLYETSLTATDRKELLDFEMQSAALYRAVMGADKAADEIQDRINHLMVAVNDTPTSSEAQAQTLRALNTRLQSFQVRLNGDSTVSRRAKTVPMSISSRIGTIVGGHWDSQSAVTDNYRDSYAIADSQFREALLELKAIATDLEKAESALQAEGAPWTPGQVPNWP